MRTSMSRSSQCLLFSFLVAAFSLLASTTATAATITVAKDGSEDYTTIRDAVAAAEAGDTVLVTDGRTYYESLSVYTQITLDFNGATLGGYDPYGIIVGEAGAGTVIQNGTLYDFLRVIIIQGASEVSVINCTLIRSTAGYLYPVVLIESAGYMTISDCEISGATAHGIEGGWNLTVSDTSITGSGLDGIHTGSQLTASGVTVTGSGDAGISAGGGSSVTGSVVSGNGGDGIYINGSGSSTISGNEVFGNDGDGIAAIGGCGTTVANNLVSGNGASGIYLNDSGCSPGQTFLIEGNTVEDNTGTGIEHVGDTSGDQYATIRGNTISGNTVGLDIEYCVNDVVENNTFCPSNTTADFLLTGGSYLPGSNNTCDNPSGWNDEGTTGCTYACGGSPEPDLAVNKTEVALGTISGTVTNTTVRVRNAGAGTLYWEITGTEECWLTVEPTSGDSTGEEDTLTITVDPTCLGEATGSYSGTFTVSNADDASDLENVEVSFAYGDAPPDIEIISIDSSGAQGAAWSSQPSISSSGTRVAFTSEAALVAGDTNGAADIFVRSREDPSSTTRESVSYSGAQGSGAEASLSADGRWLAFMSRGRLTPGVRTPDGDVYIRDLDEDVGAIWLVSCTSAGESVADGQSYAPSVSDDGMVVVFASHSANLVPGDGNDETPAPDDVFIRNRETASTIRVTGGNGPSWQPCISSDGRFVAFTSAADDLVGGDGNGYRDVFLYDVQELTLGCLTVGGNGPSHQSSISGDGRYVSFCSEADNLVLGDSDTNGMSDIFMYDTDSDSIARVTDGDGASHSPSISDDGRFVVFASDATDLDAPDANGASDIFVYDSIGHETRCVTMDSDGGSTEPDLSPDGGFVAFRSSAATLVPGDDNGYDDIFLASNPLSPNLEVNENNVPLGTISVTTQDDSIHVYNAGTGSFDWTVSGDEESWLTVSPTSGSIDGDEQNTLTVTADPIGLTYGQPYDGDFTVSRDGTPGDAETVNVSFTYGPDIDPEPPIQTNYWDFSATGMLGAKASVGTPDLLETAFSIKAVEVYGEVEGGAGLRYELSAGDTGDILELTRSHSGGAKGGIEFGSIDVLGVVEGHAAVVEGGGRAQQGVTYTFDDPYTDDHQAQAIIALTVADLVEMGATVSPLLGGPIGALLLENSIQTFTADDRTAERSELEGFFQADVAEFHVGSDKFNFNLKGALPGSALGYGGAIGGYWERRLEDSVVTGYADGMYASGYVTGGAFVPALYIGEVDRGTSEYGTERNALGTAENYVASVESQSGQGEGLFAERQSYNKRTYVIPAAEVTGLLPHVGGTPLGQLIGSQVIQLATDGATLFQAFVATHDGVLAYSADAGGLSVGDYELSAGEAQVHAFDFSISLPVPSGFANLTPKVGIGASAITGWEYVTETGSIHNGALVPEHIYAGTAVAPTYEGYDGFFDMMGVIFNRALTSVIEDLWEQLMPQIEAIAAGTEEIIDAIGAAGEGATQLIVDASEFGAGVTAGITSFGSDVAGVIFGAGAAPEASLPYRSDSVVSIASLLADDEILTLVGRTHHVYVDGASGVVPTFPTGGVRLRTTVLREQVLAAGLPAEALDSVTLYHYLPDTATWEEMAVDDTSTADSVTLEAILYEPGEYAPGVARLRSEPGMPEIVNIRPVHHEMVSGPTVTLSAIVHADGGFGGAVMTLDGQTVAEPSTSLSSGGTYLSVEKSVALDPGLHRLIVSATDSAEHWVTRSCNFYVDREYTFPDVARDYWAWRWVEAARLAGVVQGYPGGYYYPEVGVTRDQMAVYISRALSGGDVNVPEGPGTPSFWDVPADHWAYKYVEYAVSRNVVQGYSEGDYKPTVELDRGQMAVFIGRAIAYPTGDEGLEGYDPPSSPSFLDVPEDFWAYKYIEYCASRGVVQGYAGGSYQPQWPVSRAGMAVYVARAFDLTL